MTRDNMIMVTQMGITCLDDGNVPWLPPTDRGERMRTPIYDRLKREEFTRFLQDAFAKGEVRRWGE